MDLEEEEDVLDADLEGCSSEEQEEEEEVIAFDESSPNSAKSLLHSAHSASGRMGR